MNGSQRFTGIRKLLHGPFFKWGMAGIMAAVIGSWTPSSAIESLTETESRGVAAEGGLAFGEGMEAETEIETDGAETSGNPLPDTGASLSEEGFYTALQLFFPLAGLTEDNIHDILSRAEVRVGKCDLLTTIRQKTTGTEDVVNGFTFILPECGIKMSPQVRELTVNVPGTDNEGQSMGQVRRTGGVIRLQGGVVEISGPLPQVPAQTP